MDVTCCQWLQGLHCLKQLWILVWCAKLTTVNNFPIVKVLNVAKTNMLFKRRLTLKLGLITALLELHHEI